MAEQDNTLLNADYLYVEVDGEEGKELNLEFDQRLNLVGVIQDRFKVAEDARITDERRWIKSYENYRGLYGKKIRFRESEKSRVFVKITKTKVLAAFGQLVDVVFGTGKFPIGIAETRVHEAELENAHLDTQNPVAGIETTPELQGEEPTEEPVDNPYDVGYAGDGKVLKAGATLGKGLFEESLEDKAENAGLLAEGFVPIPQIPELSPAQRAARRMEKLIHDQIEESNGSSEIRNALLEAALLGTGDVTNAPQSIFADAGAGSTAAISATSVFDMERAVLNAGVQVEGARLAYLMDLNAYAAAKAAVQVTGVSALYDTADKTMNGYFAFQSTNVGNGGASGKDHALFGDFSKVHIAQFGGLDVIYDIYTNAGTGEPRYILTSLVDGDAVQNDAAFATLIEA